MTYNIIIRREGDQYLAVCPQIPGLSAAAVTAGAALDAVQQRLNERLGEQALPPPVLVEVRATLRSDVRLA